MKSRTHVEMLLSMLFLLLSSNAFAVTMDYVGAWNATTTYLVGKVVTYNSVSYYSKLNNASNINKNRTPNTQTAYWEVIGGNTATLAANVTALQTEVSNLKTANASLTTTVNTLKTTVANLQTANTNLTNRVAAAEAVNTTQNTNITNVTTRVAAAEAVNTTQNTNITNVTTRVTAAEAVNTTQNSNITNLTNRITAAEAVNTTQTTNISTLQSNNIAGLSSVLSYDANTKNVLFSGVNVQIVNGLGSSYTQNGFGNLIVGYNELSSSISPYCTDGAITEQVNCVAPNKWSTGQRSGSHNFIVGWGNEYTNSGAIVAGSNSVSNEALASVLAGDLNIASGIASSVSGGAQNKALASYASVSGGWKNKALSESSSVSGGSSNEAGLYHGFASNSTSVSGGIGNRALALGSSVSGGTLNSTFGDFATVSGGRDLSIGSMYSWAAGGIGTPVFSAP